MSASPVGSATGRPPRTLAWLAVAALGLVMMLGNIVSSTGSGLGCPDWPLCHGRVIPPGGTEIWIEFRHRLAVPLFSVLLVATAVTILRRRGSAPGLRRIAVALLVGLAAQIVLGGVTVLLGLSAVVSTIHLVVALSILAGLVYVCAAPAPGESFAPVPDRLGRLAAAGVAALAVQLVLGGYVRHAGAGLACPAFPLCDGGGFLPAHWLAAVHWTHRWLGVLLLGMFVHLGAEARPTALAAVGTAAGLAAVAQVALGVAAVLLGLPPAARAAHAGLGYTLWALAVWLAIRGAAASAGRLALARGATAGAARAGVAR